MRSRCGGHSLHPGRYAHAHADSIRAAPLRVLNTVGAVNDVEDNTGSHLRQFLAVGKREKVSRSGYVQQHASSFQGEHA